MRSAVVSLVLLALASAAFAQMKPAAVAPPHSTFPLLTKLNPDGLDDLIVGRRAFINQGTSFFADVSA